GPPRGGGTPSASWTFQLARLSFRSPRRPSTGETGTARSSAPSPLKSPTRYRGGGAPRTASPNARRSPSSTSLAVGGGRDTAKGGGEGPGEWGTCGSISAGSRPRRAARAKTIAAKARITPATRAVLTGNPLQRVEERDELVLLRRREVAVVVDHRGRLPGMPEDRLVAVERLPVMHQPAAGALPPQGRRAQLVA